MDREVSNDSMETDDSNDGSIKMKKLLDKMIASKTLNHLKKSVDFMTGLLENKGHFYDLKDFFHFFCIICETAIEEPLIQSVTTNLNAFFRKTIDVCYEMKCLSKEFENDFRFYNCIQLLLKTIIDKTNAGVDSVVFEDCVPLMLRSMVIIVSTIHDLKEVVIISRPICNEVIRKRLSNGFPVNTEEWKTLMSCLMSFTSAWQQVSEIEVTDDQKLTKFVVYCVDKALASDPFVSHISDKTIRHLSQSKGIPLDDLFIENQMEIGSHVLHLLTINFNFNDFGNVLHKTMSLFGINCIPYELLLYIIPHFVVKCDSITQRFIEEISKIDEKPVKEVMTIYFNHIIHYVFYSKTVDKSVDNIRKLIEFLSRFSALDIEYRIKVVSFDLINQLLMHWSEDYISTLEGIAFVLYYRTGNKEKKLDLNYYKNNEYQLKRDLEEFFLAFVHRFDSLIQDYSVPNRQKMNATNSFVLLLQFMNSQCINTFKVKIFSTIKLLLSERFSSNNALLRLSIEAMNQFVKTVDKTYLSSQLLTISALMLPLIHFWPNETSNVFKELIVKHRMNPEFQTAFKHLYFIPELNELTEVTDVLRPYLTFKDNEESVCERILLVVNTINHENSRVQTFSLQELLKLLSSNQSLIYKKCNNIKDFNCDSFVNQIVTQLLLSLKSSHRDVIQLVAECLGVLGAIDPLRIELEKPVIPKEEKQLFLNSNEKEFKTNLIERLYRSMSGATKTSVQYAASYALQEIMKQFTDDGFRTDDLPQEIRDYCNLLKKTHYKLNFNVRPTEPVSMEPIFGSHDLTYEDWLKEWVTSLFHSFIFTEETDNQSNELYGVLSQCSFGNTASQRSDEFESNLAESLVKYSIKTKFLKVCYFAIIRDQSVAQFLLPYIVITALKNATSGQKQFIVNEVKTIITKLTTSDSMFVQNGGHLSSQTVFLIYDYLKIWYKNRLLLHKNVCSTPRHLKTAKLMDKEFKGVKYFIESISTQELAVLAFKCNGFSRSLRYIEEYIKSLDNTFQEQIPFLQRIFIRLDEPDSVDGCNCKRYGVPDLNQRILTHEAMGQIQEALVCAAKAVELNSETFDCIEKYLQISLDSFDQSENVYTYGTGLMARRPEWRPKLAPYMIEAVWRLGDWKRLNELLVQNDDSLITFGSEIGDLFCTIIERKDTQEFELKLSSLRTRLVGPLSATAMEINGYIRGHKYIVNLHVLYDIQLIYNKLIEGLEEDICSIESLKSKFLSIVELWNHRNELIRKSTECQEPILNAQRALLNIMSNRAECVDLSSDIKKQLFKSWLLSTKTSRKSGNIQRSYNCLLEMNKMRESLTIKFGDEGMGPLVNILSDIENSEAIIENAKVLWIKNNKIDAIQYLKNQIEENYSYSLEKCFQKAVTNLSTFSMEEISEIRNSLSFGSVSGVLSSNVISIDSSGQSSGDDDSDEAFAKLQLLYTKYCDKNEILNQNTLAILYKSVTIAAPESEESHYNLGMYCYKIYTNFEESKRSGKTFSLGKPEEILEMKGRVVKSLVESLKYGVKHAHNSLPLLLNIWFDLGTEYHYLNTRSKNTISSQQMCEEIRRTVEKINNSINNLLANVPLFIFFISFAQLTARVLHPMPSITAILKKIIIRLINEFPQQSMWLLLRSLSSQHLNRRNCFHEIISKAIVFDANNKPELQAFIPNIIEFSKHLTEMCQKNPEGVNRLKGQRVKQLSFRIHFPKLAKMFDKTNRFSRILLPFQSLVNVSLPKSMHEKNYNPFPSRGIFIEGFDDCIDLLHSLQRPKKIVINGSDGKKYTILCKPGDDLRKDYCFTEFSNLLNRCFKRDSESRRRQLRVKTYLVVSLSDTCGLIEWVEGLIPFRTIVENQYRMIKEYDGLKDSVIKSYPTHANSKAERVRRFQVEILPQFKPSVFVNWFATTYTDPLSWFTARLTYTRSTAIFSIIGYLLGLGDRHGENIMIEESSGQTVHVDLNCMFNKGEEFQVPERVPFRLTHNMVNAMGVTEFEGTFRKACEHALRVARLNKDALMNFVTPFRYDHLIEWSRNNSEIRSQSSETTLEQAEKIVFNIDARLKGIPSRNDRNLPKGLSLSVEGQVDQIIKEATDVNNLGVMYVGWTAYL